MTDVEMFTDKVWFHLPITKPHHDTFFLNALQHASGSAQYTVADPEHEFSPDSVLVKEHKGDLVQYSREAFAPYEDDELPEYRSFASLKDDYSVEVEVVMRYSPEDIKQYTRVKPIQRKRDEGTEVGVVLAVEDHVPFHHYQLSFEVAVRFPPALQNLHRLLSQGTNWATTIPSLSSLYIDTAHISTKNSHIFISQVNCTELFVEDKNGKVQLEKISADDIIHVNGQNGALSASELKAKRAKFENQNASVSVDTITVAEALEVTGKNGRQEVVKAQAKQIKIINQNGSIRGSFTIEEQLILESVNGSQDVKVELIEPTDKNSHAAHVTSKGVNGSIAIVYTAQPANRPLYSKVTNSNGRVTVHHAPNYEGDFKISSIMGNVSYKVSSNKHHQIQRDERGFPAGRTVEGRVWNGKDEEEKGGASTVENNMGSVAVEF
ncbi:hypothetical protein BT69DRAFT_1319588 [Atractiella rhizophila]|nr:hypothetical protein BT69DRAFT_1319588 [Atractiella rhizophila]